MNINRNIGLWLLFLSVAVVARAGSIHCFIQEDMANIGSPGIKATSRSSMNKVAGYAMPYEIDPESRPGYPLSGVRYFRCGQSVEVLAEIAGYYLVRTNEKAAKTDLSADYPVYERDGYYIKRSGVELSKDDREHIKLSDTAQSDFLRLTRKGDSVICTYSRRKTELPENPLKYVECMNFLGRFESFAGEQIPRSIIGDSQGIAVYFVAEPEFAFVVSTPELMGRLGIA